ncbi:MAG: hypothetical protein IJZ35_01225 [Clostridia bacterium]|nr:hypothetical protein [Clostridia bacterium]
MEITTPVNNWLCTFEFTPTQHNFSRCIQTIIWLENIAQFADCRYDDKTDDFLSFDISRVNNNGINNIKTLLTHEEVLNNKNPNKIKKIISKNKLLSGLEKDEKANRFFYYFRLVLNEDENDIIELQHLILLLQSIPNIQNKIAVRIMKGNSITWETKDYFRVSHFLRFVQQKYHCFYACYNKNFDSLQSLSQNTDGTQSTFLPLLEVDGKLCQMLNKTWLISNNYQNQNYDKLYTALYPKNCNSEDVSFLLFNIGFKMLFRNLNGKKYKTSTSKKELLTLLCNVVEEVQGISPLDILLLGSLIKGTIRSNIDSNSIKELLGRIQMLSLAVSQILENIVNHSERGTGVFTFRQQSNLQYLTSHYPGYEINNDKTCLEILISDTNQNDGIVRHFLNSNKADTAIKELSSKIYLSHLFGDYGDTDIKTIWQNAREKRPEMCHGLHSFLNSVKKLGGEVVVRSSPEFNNQSLKDIYFSKHTFDINKTAKLFEGSFIPGTQFSVIINPLAPTEPTVTDKTWAFDFNKFVYATTYRELAQALTFNCEVKEFIISNEHIKKLCLPFSQENKDTSAQSWKNWFNSQIDFSETNKKEVYVCDLEILCQYLNDNQEIGEPFCKGFLSSNFFVNVKENSYYSILFLNPNPLFSRIFSGTLQAVYSQDFFKLNNSCVYFYPKDMNGKGLIYCAATLHDLLNKEINTQVFPRVFPYFLFLKNSNGHTLFEEELLKQANTSILNNKNQGFKIEETHMRLGNKVHLDTFYEMALFFENPNYAYYTAFLFLQSFLKRRKDLIKKKKIIFYGYASYSRAIVWAIIQILKEYKLIKEEIFPDIAFVIYQNDLKLESEQPQIQMYYSKEEWQRNPHSIWKSSDSALVMIVPISSSLTTFNKMRAELTRATNQKFEVVENFTAFWVRNKYENINQPTKEEENFWSHTDSLNKTIKSDIVLGNINYLVSVTSKWSNSLGCKKCFPDDPILELPLVETDPTSTVPTQQFYCKKNVLCVPTSVDSEQEEQNDIKVAKLKNNIIYGHTSKGSSHYQYYIKTREFFQQESAYVKEWLENLRKKTEDEDSTIFSPKCINILVIPQQTNNVEFGQYVYEYYFKGCAECIIINTEKEFRSNLKAEYSGLFKRLLDVDNPSVNINFHYVDVAINSGNSFSRMVSLISSCMNDYCKEINQDAEAYRFQFSKIFLLISRLSNDSKHMYVQNANKNFHSYVEVNISAMRTFGDSCVPCKLQQEAKDYYKKAATKSISAYWEKKIFDRACISFDAIDDSIQGNTEMQEEGYKRMMCTHRAAHYIRPIQGAEISTYFSAVRNFLEEIRTARTANVYRTHIYDDINENNHHLWLSAALKILVRPFFSYDYRMRCVVMDLYLILSEYLINGCTVENFVLRLKKAENKSYLLKNDNIEWIVDFANSLMNIVAKDNRAHMVFIRNNILKGLADIKSNYVLRKNTIIGLTMRLNDAYTPDCDTEIEEFFEHYTRTILRMTQSSSDESKSVWLEYLLQYGEEYPQHSVLSETSGTVNLSNAVPQAIKSKFINFIEVLLIENNRPLYQAVNEFNKRKVLIPDLSPTSLYNMAKNLLDEYHMKNAFSFISYSHQNIDIYYALLCELGALLDQLKDKSHDIKCYDKLGDKLQKIAYHEMSNYDNIIIVGKNSLSSAANSEYLSLPNYFTLFPKHFDNEAKREKSEQKKRFESQWEEIIGNGSIEPFLERNGFQLLTSNTNAENFNIMIKLDNNYDSLKSSGIVETGHQKIEPIYIYIPCETSRSKALYLTRMILMFRKKIIEWLENDFNNNAISILSQQQHLAQILSTDKMGDHAENDFVECQQKLLMLCTSDGFNKELVSKNWEYAITPKGNRERLYEISSYDVSIPLGGQLSEVREWFLLRTYVNSRIARLFRAMARSVDESTTNRETTNMEKYYLRDARSVMMRPVLDLQSVFFTPLKIGYIRKNYLEQMMKTITFVVNDNPDYGTDNNASIEQRLNNLEKYFEDFKCISFYDNNNDCNYAYLAEYLSIILLDCFISGLKAGKIWNESKWGGEAFNKLNSSIASNKCKIYINREPGNSFDGVSFDYLVISNDIYFQQRFKKKGPGMSQAAICWYIEGLWRNYIYPGNNSPKVIKGSHNNTYIIKLPILKSKEDI